MIKSIGLNCYQYEIGASDIGNIFLGRCAIDFSKESIR